MKKWTVNALQISLVIISIIILSICVFWLPQLATDTARLNPEVAYLQYPVLIGMYLTCIPFYLGVFHAFKLLNLIKKEHVFSDQAGKSLGTIIFSALGVIFIYILGIVYLGIENALPPGLSLMGIGIIFVTFIITVFAMVLKALLIKVIEIKDENDLTI